MTKLNEIEEALKYANENLSEIDGEDGITAKALTQLTALRETHILVPREPIEEQWDRLARAIMMGRDLNCNKAHEMRKHLTMSGYDIPLWLDEELQGEKHLSKGDMCVLIYKAMLSARPNIGS